MHWPEWTIKTTRRIFGPFVILVPGFMTELRNHIMIPMDQGIPAGSGISYVPRDVFHFLFYLCYTRYMTFSVFLV